MTVSGEENTYGEITRTYTEKSVKKRIEAFLLDNIGKIVTREQILEVARDPVTEKEPENWQLYKRRQSLKNRQFLLSFWSISVIF